MRKPPLVLLDKSECEFKLIMASMISFAFKHGAATVFKVNVTDPEFLIRYKLGERDFETGLTKIKMLEGDLVEANGKLYKVDKIQRCSNPKLVFAQASLFQIPEQMEAA